MSNPDDDLTQPIRVIRTAVPQPNRPEPHIEWGVAYADGALAEYDDEKQARDALTYALQQHRNNSNGRIRQLYAGARLVVRTVTAWTDHPGD